MSMSNLIKCRQNYSKLSRNSWKYYKDEPTFNNANKSFRPF